MNYAESITGNSIIDFVIKRDTPAGVFGIESQRETE